MKKVIITTFSDSNYFNLLKELISSIKRFPQSNKVSVGILDGGLNAWKLIGGQLTKINYKIKKSNYKCGIKKKKPNN